MTKNCRKWDYFFMTVVSMDINLLIIMVFPSRNIFHCNIEIKTQILVYPGSHRSTTWSEKKTKNRGFSFVVPLKFEFFVKSIYNFFEFTKNKVTEFNELIFLSQFILKLNGLNPSLPRLLLTLDFDCLVSTKRSYILKQTCSSQQQVC